MNTRPSLRPMWPSGARFLLVAGVLPALLGSCGVGSQQLEVTDGLEVVGAPTDRTGSGRGAAAGSPPERFAQGQAVFDQLCTACHTVQPPPNLAPPMMAIAGYYHEAFDDRDEAIAAIAAWITNPSPDRSIVPQMAMERFGLMAPLPLPDSSSQAVSAWVWDMYDPADDPHLNGGMGGKAGMGKGRGMNMHPSVVDTTRIPR